MIITAIYRRKFIKKKFKDDFLKIGISHRLLSAQ